MAVRSDGDDNALKCVSLFSGCGGLDLGLARAGFRIVLANDIEPKCTESHSRNFAEVPLFLGSISELTQEKASEISGGATADVIDLLAGGPPCPPYSKSRFYRKELPRALEDPVGWESLNGYLRTLKWLKPRAFLLENVAGLAYKVHRDAFELVISTANSLGYKTTWRVLNAADFGVPQIRERLFVVGVREGEFVWPEPTHAEQTGDDLFEAVRAPWRTAGDAIGDLDTPTNADDKGHFAGGQYHHLLREIPPGDNYLFFTEKRGHPDPKFQWRSRYWSFLLKLSPAMPSWTIQARRSNNMGPFHWRNRILRISEVKRLQTFPDDWYLSGTVEQQWRQVGNAVPVRLAERLGNALTQTLSRSNGQPQKRQRAEAVPG
ncbi:MAG: DNA cytosine methyltransferase [Gemmatimonadaceae bacterium]